MTLSAILDQHGRPARRDLDTKAATSGLASPGAWLLDLFGANPSRSGVVVTPATAMRCTAVRCAVQAIAEAVGQLPVHVYGRTPDGAKDRAPEHPVHRLVHDEANEWTSASDFREQLTRDALLHGNGFAFINRVEGRLYDLTRLAPEGVSVDADPITGEPIYRVVNGRAEQDRRTLPRENVLHIRAPSLDGLSGDAPITQARDAIGLALVMEQHAAQLFGNGARPSGVVTIPGSLPPEAVKRLQAAWQATHGTGRSGGTAVLNNGATWQALTLNSVDAQFLELRKFAVEEIARAFRVPPVLMMDYGRQTWSNAEEGGRQFLTFTLLPWIKRWEGELRLKLFSRDERETFFAEFLTDDLLRADYATRMDGYAKAIAARVLNPNEARAAENRAPYAGGERFENPNTATTGAAVAA